MGNRVVAADSEYRKMAEHKLVHNLLLQLVPLCSSGSQVSNRERAGKDNSKSPTVWWLKAKQQRHTIILPDGFSFSPMNTLPQLLKNNHMNT